MLKLDFALETVDERLKFVNDLINEGFVGTDADNEMIANYLLWGKDPALDNQNSVQSKIVLSPARDSTWDVSKDSTFESLDNLLLTPGFNEATINPITSSPTHLKRRVFDRETALAQCPPHLIPTYTELFRAIDILDLQINLWEFDHGRRQKPPREELLNRFTPEEISSLKPHWNQAQYLKARHRLVELRREQYTYKDTYNSMVTKRCLDWYTTPDSPIQCGTDIEVLPLGLYNPLVFRTKFNPADYSEADLKKITSLLWTTESDAIAAFDFRQSSHVYNLLLLRELVIDETLDPSVESTAQSLLQTLDYYADCAELNESQREIYDLKLKGQKNQEIADYVNQKYGKSYSVNYISTIFCQKIVPRINDAAVFHREQVENLFFEENWRRCSMCGELLLLDPKNYVRKARSKDGFSSTCKRCDKKKRDSRRKK